MTQVLTRGRLVLPLILALAGHAAAQTATGKVTCAIKPSARCVDSPGKYTQTACGFITCIDAADTNRSGLIDAGDRFSDSGNGSATNHQTGLMWEKKDQSGGLHDAGFVGLGNKGFQQRARAVVGAAATPTARNTGIPPTPTPSPCATPGRSGSIVVFENLEVNAASDPILSLANVSVLRVRASCFYADSSQPTCSVRGFDVQLDALSSVQWQASVGGPVLGAGNPFSGELVCVEVDLLGAPFPGNHLVGTSQVGQCNTARSISGFDTNDLDNVLCLGSAIGPGCQFGPEYGSCPAGVGSARIEDCWSQSQFTFMCGGTVPEINCGEPLIRQLAAGATNVFTFTAESAGAVSISVSDTSGTIGLLELALSEPFGPNGEIILADTCTGRIDTPVNAGLNFIQVRDCIGADTGSYTLTLSCGNAGLTNDACASATTISTTPYADSVGTAATTVAIVNFSQSTAASPSSPPNVLVQTGSLDPVRFTLNFSAPRDSVAFTRPMLVAGSSGITHPLWSAHALNALGQEISTVGEGLIASFTNVPAQAFTLSGPGITAVRVDSNNEHFAAFSAVLIDDLTLSSDCAPPASPTPPPAPTPAGDCCTAHDPASPSCSDGACQACVCDLDSFCCTGNWDSSCADKAHYECAASCNCPTYTPTPTTATCATNAVLNFDSVDASTGNVDATSYLGNFGITLSGVTTPATTEAGDPTPSCGKGARSKSVWYQFTAPSDGTISADTFGSSYDTVLSVFSGSCGTLTGTEVACNDDTGGSQSQVSFAAAAGATYHFMVSAFKDDGGTLVFNVTFAAQATLSAGSISGQAGQTVAVPITINTGSASVASFQVLFVLVPLGGAPALTDELTYQAAAGVPAPDLQFVDQAPARLGIGYVGGIDPPLTGTVQVGTLMVPIPAGASGTYQVQVDQVSALDSSGQEVTLTGQNGTVTVRPCVGDCDGLGVVSVDELITLVNVALGSGPLGFCVEGDANANGQISIDEIVTAVDNALNGCP